MSKISAAYDGILAKIIETYPDKTRIPYPYSLPDNVDNLLEDGWGIKIGPGSPSELIEYCTFNQNKELILVFTREMVALESDTDVQDDIGKKLLEDVYVAQKLMNNPNKMDIDAILDVQIGGHTGVTEAKSGQRKFLAIEASFQVGIQEKL